MQKRTFALAFAVLLQFLLELTAGRVFVAPSIVPFMLVYLWEHHESFWAVDGAFWAGLCLDLLLHQPVGSSSIAFLTGMYAVSRLSRISAGGGRGYLIGMTSIAVAVSDTVFILVASRPVGSGFGPALLRVFPRVGLTALTAAAALFAASGLANLRSGKVEV